MIYFVLIGSAVVIVMCVVVTIWNIWSIHNTIKAGRQRRVIIRCIPLNGGLDLFDDLEAVSFDEHVHELNMLRDPMNLYSDRLRSIQR